MVRHVLGVVLVLAGVLVAIPAKAEEKPAGGSDALAAGNTAFAFDLFGKLSASEGNIFVSPFSVSTALAMVYAGARGSTADEMAKALHFGLPADDVHARYEELLAALAESGGSSGVRLDIANALWADQQFDFRAEYIQLVESRYRAKAAELDFRTQAEAARQTINAWVATHTNDKIKELLPQGLVTPDTRLVLTNAVYFKSKWLSPFEKDATEEAPFHAPKGDVPAHFMRKGGEYLYADNDLCQIVEMPYAGESTSMLVILPKSAESLAALEKDLSADWLTRILASREERQVRLALPRFAVRYSSQLADTLAALGMPSAFTASADLSGMNAAGGLFLSAVVHEAFVEVNEEGTEAAGATGAVIAVTSAPPTAPVEFRADHPFIYLIRHNPTGSILFLGRLSEPK